MGVTTLRWIVVTWGVAWNALELVLRTRSISISSHLKPRTWYQPQRTKDFNPWPTSQRNKRPNGLYATAKQPTNGTLHGKVQCRMEETNDWEREHS